MIFFFLKLIFINILKNINKYGDYMAFWFNNHTSDSYDYQIQNNLINPTKENHVTSAENTYS